jgi:hypothetical protein
VTNRALQSILVESEVELGESKPAPPEAEPAEWEPPVVDVAARLREPQPS